MYLCVDSKLKFEEMEFYFFILADKVMFDNSYSYFKGKKIKYSVLMTTPLSEIEKAANDIAIDEGLVVEAGGSDIIDDVDEAVEVAA
jgi:hypothetical protein